MDRRLIFLDVFVSSRNIDEIETFKLLKLYDLAIFGDSKRKFRSPNRDGIIYLSLTQTLTNNHSFLKKHGNKCLVKAKNTDDFWFR